MVIEFEKRELGTLRRLLRAELHSDLNNGLSTEEHNMLIRYKFKLLKKLGSSDTLQKVRIYENHC